MRIETKKRIRLGVGVAGGVLTAVVLAGVIRFLTLPPLGLKPGIPLQASYKVDGGPYHIGDFITVQLEVAAAAGVKYRMPDPAVSGMGKLELQKSLGRSGEWRRGDRLERAGYIVTAWNTGEYVLPGCAIPYQKGNLKGVYKVHPFKLKIVSVLPAGKSTAVLLKLPIKGIKGPLDIPPRYAILWLSLGLLALAAGLGLGISRLRHYLKQHPHTTAATETLLAPQIREPAHLIALRRLAELEQCDYVAGLAFKVYYSELSEIIREYMENRFQTKALEMTTEEFLGNLAAAGILGASQQILLRDFLTAADLVKFAKQIPPENEAREDLDRVRRLVRETAALPEQHVAVQTTPVQEPAGLV